MIVARPLTQLEPDLLVGLEHKQLVFVGIFDGTLLARFDPPPDGWDYESLERVGHNFESRDPWNAILGGRWVGSSEI